jgi:hypothetical protein
MKAHNVEDAASSWGVDRKAYAARLAFLAPSGTMNLTAHANVCGRGSGASLTYKFLASVMIIQEKHTIDCALNCSGTDTLGSACTCTSEGRELS